MFSNFMRKLSGIRKPEKGTAKYWLLMLFAPSVLLIDESEADKSGLVLSVILFADLVVLLALIFFAGHANVLCLICYIAVNVWCWLSFLTSDSRD